MEILLILVYASICIVVFKIFRIPVNYRIECDAPWKPTQVFDDGAKVYI
jgi:hypothetical protein